MTTASDAFNRANETPIASPWTAAVGSGANLASNALTSTAGVDKISFYSGTWGNDQECTFTIGGLSANTNYAAGALRFNATSGGNGYEFITDSGTGAGHSEVGTWTNGSYATILNVASTFANGDVVRFTVVGTTITVYKNGASVGSVVNSAFSSGNPGAGAFGTATVDNWSATDNAVTAAVGSRRFSHARNHPGDGPRNGGKFFKTRRKNTNNAPAVTISGTSATTNANDTSGASGTTTVVGTSATTNANDTSTSQGAAAGAVGSRRRRAANHPGAGPYNRGKFQKSRRGYLASFATITGTVAVTNANDTSSAAGTPTVIGSLARTNGNDTSSASGTTTVTATSATTNANDTSSAAGTTTVVGTSARTNANDASSSAGTTTVVGSSASTNANDTSSATGAAGTVVGTSATTNANDAAAAEGSTPRLNSGIPPNTRFNRPKFIRLYVEDDEEETEAEPAAIAQAVQTLVKRAVRTGTAKVPSITVEGDIPRSEKREIRAAFRAEFNRDAGVIAAKAQLRQQQEQDDEESLLWLI